MTEKTPDNERFSDLELSIAGCEKNCDGEVVVFIAGSSGPYSDIPFVNAGIAAFCAAGFISFTTLWVSKIQAIFLIVSAFLLGSVLHKVVPELLMYLTSDERQNQQVENAGNLVFVQQAISQTRNRTGILLYLSLLEQKARLTCDVSIRSKVPPEIIGELEHELSTVAASEDPVYLLPAFIRELGEVLAEYVPPGETNPDELENTPLVAREVSPER